MNLLHTLYTYRYPLQVEWMLAHHRMGCLVWVFSSILDSSVSSTGGCFCIKMLFYYYRDSRPSYLYNGNTHTLYPWGPGIQSAANRLISQIPQCISPISHNATLCNRNVHISVTKWCIVGYFSDALWDLWDGSIGFLRFLSLNPGQWQKKKTTCLFSFKIAFLCPCTNWIKLQIF